MRLISATFLGGCLLGLVVGCSGRSNQVEIPKNATPPPKNPPTVIGGGNRGGPVLPAPSPGGATSAPKK
jgi:hypothetical protein